MLLALQIGVGVQAATTVTHTGSTWNIQNQNLKVTLTGGTGYLAVKDLGAGYTWTQPGAITHYPFTNMTALSNGVSFNTSFVDSKIGEFTANVQVVVPDGAREMQLMVSMTNLNTAIGGFSSIEPFTLATPTSYLIAPDYCDGHMYPSNISAFPEWNLASGYRVQSLDMPWVGVFNISSGVGYSIIVATPYDAMLNAQMFNGYRAPWFQWNPSLGTLGYTRQLNYEFTANGGYVALAKAYRSYVQAQGGLVTLDTKAQTNPNIKKLFGAPVVWDYFNTMDPAQAKAAGVDKMLHHVDDWGDPNDPSNDLALLKQNQDQGYLTEEYDSYCDAYPETANNPLGSYYDSYPNNFAKDVNGNTEPGFVGQYGQMYHRCPEFFQAAAQAVIPSRLAAYPSMARYLDVHTATATYECYDPNHPQSTTQWENNDYNLLSYIRGQGLVLSGEHGKWWAVPVMDVMDGVMSSPVWPWTNQPTAYQQGTPSDWTTYETYGSIGNTYRVPLWELVFHDCSLAMWYPDDATDYTANVPGDWYQTKKDCMNVLYGTPSLFFNVGPNGSWWVNRPAFMTSYRTACKVHEALADQEMLTHQFLTTDRNVQQTTWTDGTVDIVNFGTSNYTATIGGTQYVLPQYGFAVSGPKITSYRAIVSGSTVTSVTMAGYNFSTQGGVAVTVRRFNNHFLRVNIDGACPQVSINPLNYVTNWKFATTHMWQCDTEGNRTARVSWTQNGNSIVVGPFTSAVILDICDGITKNDFDGDGKADLAYYTPGSPIVWTDYSSSSSYTIPTTYNWGDTALGDVPMSGDFDGDGKTDYAVYRPGNPSTWLISYAAGGTANYSLGTSGDIPVVGDFDGDGISDIGVVHTNSNGMYWWTVLLSSKNYDPSAALTNNGWGWTGTIPFCGDFDGDGKSDWCIYVPGNPGEFDIWPSSSWGQMIYDYLGAPGDVPFVGDFDGDGLSDFGVAHPNPDAYYWNICLSSQNFNTSNPEVVGWGWSSTGDFLTPWDFNGTGISEIAIYRPGVATWWLDTGGAGTGLTEGSASAIPLGQPTQP